MRAARLLLIGLAVVISATGAACLAAHAAEAIMLRAGQPTAASAVFAFDRKPRPREIIVRTVQAGVAGSRLDVTIDKAKHPVFAHIFSTEECKYGGAAGGGSMCEVRIPAGDAAYRALLAGLKRGRAARITIIDAGVMKMDQTVSLKGFARLLR